MTVLHTIRDEHKNTPWFQVVINSKLTEYFYKYGTADTLTQEIFNFPARHQRAVKCKMVLTSQQRSWCVSEFHKTHSVVTVQRAFKRKFNVDPPTNKSILKWHRNFIEEGCNCYQRKGHSRRPSVSDQVIDRIRESFFLSPRKSMCRASQELKVLQSTVSKILCKRLRLHTYKLQLVQKLHLEENEMWHAFCGNLQVLLENDDDLLAKIIFSDEATFHLSGKVNRCNVRIWGSEYPHATLEVERDSPKLNVSCAVSKQNVYSPFISEGPTVIGRRYLEMITNWLISQLAADRHDYLFQQDGAPPNWHLAVRMFLNEHLPNRWIGHVGQNDQVFCKWPPRDHRTWPFVAFSFGDTWTAESMYLHWPQPWMSCRNESLQLSTRSRRISCWVWSELHSRIDVCRVTTGGRIWVCVTTCNCNHPFCKNIPVSLYFITTWN